LALQHKEPDRVPFDLAGTSATGIAVTAYKRLLTYLGITKTNIRTFDIIQQLAEVDEDVLKRLRVDTKRLSPATLAGEKPEITKDNNYRYLTNLWGITTPGLILLILLKLQD
jgi:uroporphyrinogen decarboxylase